MLKFIKRIPNLLLIVLALYIILVKICPEKVKALLGYQTFVILTDSMEPVIPTGSAVLVKNLKIMKNPKRGILFPSVWIVWVRMPSSLIIIVGQKKRETVLLDI